jgi:hypothetical protein
MLATNPETLFAVMWFSLPSTFIFEVAAAKAS